LKSFLRGIRKAIRAAFDYTGLQTGKHHWQEAKWIERAREFLEEQLRLKKVTDYEVAATILLLYHSFGPSKGKKVNVNSFIYRQLGEQGMTVYKRIFDNNSNKLVIKFF